jgi:hypothetical protein
MSSWRSITSRVAAGILNVIQFDWNWMLSRHASRRFLVLSALSLVLGALFLLTMHPAFLDAKQQSAIVKIVEITVFLPAIPGGLWMFLGMEWCCVRSILPESP